MPASLHNVHIQSRLITGFFPLAFRSCFPIEGVDFIKGNDLDAGKIYPVPEVVDSPILQSEPDDLAHRHPDVFPVCVLTRAQARKQVQGINLFDSVCFCPVQGCDVPYGWCGWLCRAVSSNRRGSFPSAFATDP